MAIEHCSLVASLNLVVSDFIVPVLLEIANQDPSVILVFILQCSLALEMGLMG